MKSLRLLFFCALAFSLQNPTTARGDEKSQPPQGQAAHNQSPPNSVPNGAGSVSGNQTSANTGEKEAGKKSPWEDPIVWFTGALVVVGALQCFVYWKQWRVMQAQTKLTELALRETEKAANAAAEGARCAIASAEVAEKALNLSNFPHVHLESVGVNLNVKDGGIAFELILKNYGQSTAQNVRVTFVLGEVKAGQVRYETIPDYALLLPVSQFNFAADIDPKIATPAFISSVKSGKELLFLNVTFLYENIFGELFGGHCGAIYDLANDKFLIIPRGAERIKA